MQTAYRTGTWLISPCIPLNFNVATNAFWLLHFVSFRRLGLDECAAGALYSYTLLLNALVWQCTNLGVQWISLGHSMCVDPLVEKKVAQFSKIRLKHSTTVRERAKQKGQQQQQHQQHITPNEYSNDNTYSFIFLVVAFSVHLSCAQSQLVSCRASRMPCIWSIRCG